mgnify:CR=1 FL=1
MGVIHVESGCFKWRCLLVSFVEKAYAIAMLCRASATDWSPDRHWCEILFSVCCLKNSSILRTWLYLDVQLLCLVSLCIRRGVILLRTIYAAMEFSHSSVTSLLVTIACRLLADRLLADRRWRIRDWAVTAAQTHHGWSFRMALKLVICDLYWWLHIVLSWNCQARLRQSTSIASHILLESLWGMQALLIVVLKTREFILVCHEFCWETRSDNWRYWSIIWRALQGWKQLLHFSMLSCLRGQWSLHGRRIHLEHFLFNVTHLLIYVTETIVSSILGAKLFSNLIHSVFLAMSSSEPVDLT